MQQIIFPLSAGYHPPLLLTILPADQSIHWEKCFKIVPRVSLSRLFKTRLLPDTSLLGFFFSHSHYCLETLLFAAAVLAACLLQWSNEDSSNTSCRSAITCLFAGRPIVDHLLQSHYCPSYVVGPSTEDIIFVRHQVLSCSYIIFPLLWSKDKGLTGCPLRQQVQALTKFI